MKLSEPHLNRTRHRAFCVCVCEQSMEHQEGGGREGACVMSQHGNQLAWDASPQMFTPYLSNT